MRAAPIGQPMVVARPGPSGVASSSGRNATDQDQPEEKGHGYAEEQPRHLRALARQFLEPGISPNLCADGVVHLSAFPFRFTMMPPSQKPPPCV